jgi:protein phosphatase
VGDSRVYRLRGERLEQLTFDHSLLWELRAAGQISDNADLTKNIPKNVITRSLGPNPKVAVDVEGPFPLQLGDTFLLCSDGLSGQVRDEELGAILGTLTPEESATTLIDLANLRGGPDNITVIVAKVLDPSLTTAAKADAANRRRPRLAINPAAVVAAGVCWFLALVLWLNQLGMPAVVAALAGVGALLGAVLLGLRPFVKKAKAAPAVASNRGKSPYRNIVCKPGDDVVTTLSAIVQELRSAAQESQWRVDWTNFERHERAAQEAAHARRHADAVRSYAKALSFMMYELRNQQSRPSRRDGDAEFQY